MVSYKFVVKGCMYNAGYNMHHEKLYVRNIYRTAHGTHNMNYIMVVRFQDSLVKMYVCKISRV